VTANIVLVVVLVLVVGRSRFEYEFDDEYEDDSQRRVDMDNWLTSAVVLVVGLSVLPAMAADTKPLYPPMPPPFQALVKDGQPAGVIVTPREPSELETLAARELQEYLKRISGAEVPIVKAGHDVTGLRVLLGRGAAPDGFELGADLGGEGFVIRTAPNALVIAGQTPRGTLYGVYTFLEKYLGVRWFTPFPRGEVVPKLKTIAIGQIADAERPDFRLRWVGRDEWAVRNKANRATETVPGFNLQPGIYHTQGRFLPRTKYFSTNPEFFALVKGQRCNDGEAKLCTSNPKVADEVAKNMRELLESDPSIQMISLSPTDGMLYCECPECAKLDEPGVPGDQRMSRRMLLFYNAVAERLEKTHPNTPMLVGAYHIYTWPPRDPLLKAHKNLAVVICHYDHYCLAHPVADPNCKANARYREIIAAWQRLTPHIFFYEYYWKVNWLDLLWPIVHSIREDIPHFKRIGVEGLYTQWTAENAETMALNYYVAAKLLWDCKLDADALLADFYEKYYGPAAAPMREYHETWEKALAAASCVPGAAQNAVPVFTPEVVGHAETALKTARRAATADPAVTERLKRVELSLDWAKRILTCYTAQQQATGRNLSAAKRRQAADLAAKTMKAAMDYWQANKDLLNGVVSRPVATGYLKIRLQGFESLRKSLVPDTGFVETVQGNFGRHANHKLLMRSITLEAGEVGYRLAYKLCLDKAAHPESVDGSAAEGLSGMGLSGPTGANWYAGGAWDVLVNGKGLGFYRPDVKVIEQSEARSVVEARWNTPEAAVTLRFSTQSERDYLAVTGTVEPKKTVESLAVKLLAQPGGFIEPRDRRVKTALRDAPHGQSLKLDPQREFWVFYSDDVYDAAKNKKSVGPCGLLFLPTEVQSAAVEVSDYPIRTELTYPPAARTFHLALWEFPQMPNAEAAKRLAEVAEAARRSLSD